MNVPSLKNSISPECVRGCLFIAVTLFSFALLPAPKAFGVSPPPDGGYSGANTAEGMNALFSLTSGIHNTAIGFEALFKNTTGNANMANGSLALFNNTTGVQNMAIGFTALFGNTTGSNNAAVGSSALHSNTTGGQNTAIGSNALFSNTIGGSNTATGFETLFNNTTGANNSATGVEALYSNTTGSNNTATGGFQTLYSNTTGSNNTATGSFALFNNTTGHDNTANGFEALFHNTTGIENTANGQAALSDNTTGVGNTANGFQALLSNTTGLGNTAVGLDALIFNSTGFNNTAFGNSAGTGVTTASNVICIFASGANVSNSCFIGNIHGVMTQNADAIPVLIDSAGQLGTMSSSRRFKKEIKPMDQTSQAVLALKPVTFQYKSDTKGIPQFGLIAEDVAKVDPDLVVRDADGAIYTVRYEAVNAMLLNEFLKEHRKVQAEEGKVAHLEATVRQQQKQIDALTAGLQKVTTQLETSRPVQTVANNR